MESRGDAGFYRARSQSATVEAPLAEPLRAETKRQSFQEIAQKLVAAFLEMFMGGCAEEGADFAF